MFIMEAHLSNWKSHFEIFFHVAKKSCIPSPNMRAYYTKVSEP